MSARPFITAAAFGLLALAGCLDSNDDDDDASGGPSTGTDFAPATTAERVADPAHNFDTEWDWSHAGDVGGHAVPDLHDHAFGLELVGYNPLTRQDEGSTILTRDSSYIAMDTWSDGTSYYACVAHFASEGAGGATLVDITDPADPVVVSVAESGMQNSDCQFTDDGKYLLVAAYSGFHDGVPGLAPPVGDAAAIGVDVYDVSDKSAPEFLFHDVTAADGSAYHNVFTATINETYYVFQTYTGTILELDPASGLTVVAQLEIADHDLWVGRHPITGEWLAITGAGNAARIYNVDDPAVPLVLSDWVPSETQFTGWHRQWPVPTTVEGRAIMVVAGEESAGESGTWYTVVDFTDPTDMRELGHWTIPAPLGATQHEFEIWDGYVATGNYHQGVWLFDVGTMERAAQPVTLGYYLPHETPALAGGTLNLPGPSNPNVWGAYFDDRGYVYAADQYSGLYVLKFEATRTV